MFSQIVTGFRHSALVLLCVAGTSTQNADASEVLELPVSADRCAIHLALTGHRMAGCSAMGVDALGATRSLGSSGGHSAMAPRSLEDEKGYFVRFAFNSDAITPAYRAHLDRLSEVIASADLQNMCIKLVGHTDSVGHVAYNDRLSDARARRVAAYLVGKSTVSSDRLTVESAGERQLMQTFPSDHPAQRRVEILARDRGDGACS